MKISLNALRFYTDTYRWAGEPAPEGVNALVEKIGAQLGAVEEVIDFGKKYEGVVVAKVVKCEQHPNADRLKVCNIDDGAITPDVKRDENGFVQVVCGAPNVREGLTVAWLPPGSTVPDTYEKDPFVLEARELRGVVSNGMLASPKELALSDSHEGILEIDQDVKPGTLFVDAFNLRDDKVIDIENKMFTHRPDLFGIIGVAREIAGIQGQKFTSPDWYVRGLPNLYENEGHENTPLELEINNELPELVSRFVAITLSNIEVKSSPVALQIQLARYGLRPINNVVDITNYVMLLTGQPLHAYDYDKVKAYSEGTPRLTVRHPQPGEKITLLNGKTIEPRAEAMMVATDKQLACVGGALGGAETEVDANTKNIILEAATWDMFSMRKTAMTHGIFTDAVTRFTKGQSPLQNRQALDKAVEMLRDHAGAAVHRAYDDSHLPQETIERKSLHLPIRVSAAFINERLGLNLNTEEIAELLENVEFRVGQIEMDLSITAPFWRTDIEIPEDIVEEVGRLYGYDHLPLELPKRTITPTAKDPMLELKAKIRATLAKAGANEVLTYSFVHGNLFDKVGQDKNQAFQLSNALSPDLQYYRLSLTPSLLEKIHPNIKAGYDQFLLFELGQAHGITELDDQALPKELGRVAGVFAADAKAQRNYEGAPYYEARNYVLDLFGAFGDAEKIKFVSLEENSFEGHVLATQMIAPFQPGRAAILYNGERPLGVVGEYKQKVQKALKLPAFSAGFEVFLSAFQNQEGRRYVPLSRFPSVTQDITLKVPIERSNEDIQELFYGEIQKLKQQNYFASVHGVDIYHNGDEPMKNVTFRITISSYEKTLRDAEVTKILDGIAGLAKEKFGAERI